MKENLRYMKDVLGVKHIAKFRQKMPAKKSGGLEGKTLEQLQAIVATCMNCKLGKTRTNTVFGSGNTKARLMFIGEDRGESDDVQSLPLVGRVVHLLTKMI